MTEKLCIFGEVLFDIFPDKQKVLGGAPFNVAWHLQAFSKAPFFISRVGDDAEGAQILKAMQDWGMTTGAVQTDQQLPTGRVVIKFNEGEPQYDIVEPVAYDAIESFTDGESVCDFLYHGSLAIRNGTSRQALEQLKKCQPATVFVDVNLREPWWDKAGVIDLLQQADWVKLNVDEFNLIYASGKGGDNPLASFIEEYGLRGVILTHGSQGAELMTADNLQYRIEPDTEVKVVDTVGAGDAFSSVFILGLVNNWPLQTVLQRAQQFASAMVGQRGATVAERSFYQAFANAWGID